MLGFSPLAKAPLATEKQEAAPIGPVNVTVNLTGVSSTSAVGTVTVTIPISISVTGVSSTSAVGTVIASIPISVPVTGVGSTSHVGGATAVIDVTVPLAGWGQGAWGSGACWMSRRLQRTVIIDLFGLAVRLSWPWSRILARSFNRACRSGLGVCTWWLRSFVMDLEVPICVGG